MIAIGLQYSLHSRTLTECLIAWCDLDRRHGRKCVLWSANPFDCRGRRFWGSLVGVWWCLREGSLCMLGYHQIRPPILWNFRPLRRNIVGNAAGSEQSLQNLDYSLHVRSGDRFSCHHPLQAHASLQDGSRNVAIDPWSSSNDTPQPRSLVACAAAILASKKYTHFHASPALAYLTPWASNSPAFACRVLSKTSQSPT